MNIILLTHSFWQTVGDAEPRGLVHCIACPDESSWIDSVSLASNMAIFSESYTHRLHVLSLSGSHRTFALAHILHALGIRAPLSSTMMWHPRQADRVSQWSVIPANFQVPVWGRFLESSLLIGDGRQKLVIFKASLFIARLRNSQSGLDYLTQDVWLVHPSLFWSYLLWLWYFSRRSDISTIG